MSRSTQMFGLSDIALIFLVENQEQDTCPECYTVLRKTERTIGHTGMFSEAPLKEYTLTDGRTATENVQYDPWSSGPMIFLSLKVSDGTEFFWTPKEANKRCGENVIFDSDPSCTKCDGGVVETNKTEHGAYISICECVKKRDANFM